MSNPSCRCCGRPLTDKSSQLKGIGRDCEKNPACKRDIPIPDDQFHDLPWDAETRDVVYERRKHIEVQSPRYIPISAYGDLPHTETITKHFNIPRRHVDHSPAGWEWGGGRLFDPVMQLDMAVRAQEGKPFGVVAHFLNLDAAARRPGHTTIQVVEMQGSLASRVATDGAAAAEGPLGLLSHGPLLVTPASLHATGAGSLLSFVTDVAERDAADVAEAFATQVNAATSVFFIRGDDLPALGAPAIGNTGTAIRGLAVFPVGDALTAVLAVQGWIRAHGIPPLDQYTSIEYAALKRHGYSDSGPADFALNILSQFEDVFPRTRASAGTTTLFDGSRVHRDVYDLHQAFKRDFLEAVPQASGGVILGKSIVFWIEQHAPQGMTMEVADGDTDSATGKVAERQAQAGLFDLGNESGK